MTTCAALLAWHSRRAQQQRLAVAGIHAAGGWVYYDYQDFDLRTGKFDVVARSSVPQWLLDTLGIDYFHRVEVVNMSFHEEGPQRLDNDEPGANADISDSLARIPWVRGLFLNAGSVDDEGMRVVGRMRSLEILMIWDAEEIGDAGVEQLRDLPNLRYLHLGGSQVGDRGLQAIASLPGLEGISMQENRFTDAGIAHLRGHPRLRSVWVGGLHALTPLTDACVADLASLPQLEELDLQHTQVTVAGLRPLTSCGRLKKLFLSGSAADDLAGATAILPGCQIDARSE